MAPAAMTAAIPAAASGVRIIEVGTETPCVARRTLIRICGIDECIQ
jgi:hypothetical protein